MITIREQIVQAVMARLTQLTTVPVLRREQYADEDVFVCVWDQTQTAERNEYGLLTNRMDVTLEYIRRETTGYASPSEAATAMYGELVKALFNDVQGIPEPTFDGLAEAMIENSMIPFTPEAGLKITGCSLQVEITYHTRNGDPFSQ